MTYFRHFFVNNSERPNVLAYLSSFFILGMDYFIIVILFGRLAVFPFPTMTHRTTALTQNVHKVFSFKTRVISRHRIPSECFDSSFDFEICVVFGIVRRNRISTLTKQVQHSTAQKVEPQTNEQCTLCE